MLRFTLFLICSIFFLGACQEESDQPKDQDLISGNNFALRTDADDFNNSVAMRSGDFSDAFEIVEAEFVDGHLNATLSYTSECETNEFEVIWSGALMESYPYQARLAIKRTASGCSANGEINEEDFSVDLAELIGDIVNEEPIIFHLINCSTDDDDADVSVQNF